MSVTSIIILSIFPPYSLIHISFLFFKICLVCLGTIYDLRLLRLEMCWVLETSILGTDLNNINSDCCLDLLSIYDLRLLHLEMCWVLEDSNLGIDLNNINSDCCLDLLTSTKSNFLFYTHINFLKGMNQTLI